MSLVQILVRARGLDPVVVSAEHALRVRLGLEGRLLALSRGDLWEVEAQAKDAAHLVSRLVSATGLLVNPNRHRYVWRSEGEAGAEKEWGEGSLAEGAATRAFILVSPLERTDESAVLSALSRALEDAMVVSAARVDLWTMDLAEPREAAAATAIDVAVTHSRRRGLLANPHFQRATVHVGVLPPLPLRGLLDGRLERRAS